MGGCPSGNTGETLAGPGSEHPHYPTRHKCHWPLRVSAALLNANTEKGQQVRAGRWGPAGGGRQVRASRDELSLEPPENGCTGSGH